jgi:hypothetical protein
MEVMAEHQHLEIGLLLMEAEADQEYLQQAAVVAADYKLEVMEMWVVMVVQDLVLWTLAVAVAAAHLDGAAAAAEALQPMVVNPCMVAVVVLEMEVLAGLVFMAEKAGIQILLELLQAVEVGLVLQLWLVLEEKLELLFFTNKTFV